MADDEIPFDLDALISSFPDLGDPAPDPEWEKDEAWDKDAELAKAQRFDKLPDRVITAQWVHQHSFQRESKRYARAKAEFHRMEALVTVVLRARGEKSADVARATSLLIPKVYAQYLEMLTAESAARADRQALEILHARLRAIQTEAADARAAGAWQGREHP